MSTGIFRAGNDSGFGADFPVDGGRGILRMPAEVLIDIRENAVYIDFILL